MQHHNNHNLGSRIQAEGMRINAQGKRNRHQHGKRASMKARLLGLASMLALLVALILWLNG
jgi:hypothetical protein